MDRRILAEATHLVGVGLYTPAEAGRVLCLPSQQIARWLRGHDVKGKHYDRLWSPQVDLGEQGIFLGFHDLQEVRVAAAFIAKGLSAYRVRQAIVLARELIGRDRPLSTSRFRTDGRSIFLQVVEQDGQTKLIDLFKKQYAFREILERSLTNVDYDDSGLPSRWWPLGRSKGIVLDPERSFGQPIEAETSVPVASLVSAVAAEGSADRAARAWDVPIRAVRRAVAYDRVVALPKAA